MARATTADIPPSKPKRKNPAVDSGVLNDADHYPDIDLTKALACAEFSRLCYRRNYYGDANQESVAFQQKEKSVLAAQFLYKAKVFSSVDQQCVIFHNGSDVIVAFEGSRALKVDHYWRNVASWLFAWFTPAPDIITQTAREVTGDKEAKAKVHYGFDNALNAPIVSSDASERGHAMWDEIKRYCKALHAKNSKTKLYFTGHSAGGALATIATARALNDMPEIEIGGLYTFGQPRVGGKYFKAGFEKRLGRDKYYRFEQYGDPMPALPPFDPEQYVPVGRWIPMDLGGHMLAKNQFEEDQPTLSAANPVLYDKIEKSYAEAHPLLSTIGSAFMTAVNGSTQVLRRYLLPQNLLDSNPELERSYSSLQNLFSARNFTEAHKIRNYSRAIQKHIDRHGLLKTQQPNVQFLHGQLMSSIILAEDTMKIAVENDKDVMQRLSPAFSHQIKTALPTIHHLMQEYETLMHFQLPKEITAPIPEIYRARNLRHVGEWWSAPLTDDVRDAKAIKATLTRALLDDKGTLNRSAQLVKRGEALNRLDAVSKVFADIHTTITAEDREAMKTMREDIKDNLLSLIDSVGESCEQMKSAMKQQPEKAAGMGR